MQRERIERGEKGFVRGGKNRESLGGLSFGQKTTNTLSELF